MSNTPFKHLDSAFYNGFKQGQAERERQDREANPTCTYWRGIRIEDLSKDELIAALHQARSMLSQRDKTIEGIHSRMFDRRGHRS